MKKYLVKYKDEVGERGALKGGTGYLELAIIKASSDDAALKRAQCLFGSTTVWRLEPIGSTKDNE